MIANKECLEIILEQAMDKGYNAYKQQITQLHHAAATMLVLDLITIETYNAFDKQLKSYTEKYYPNR